MLSFHEWELLEAEENQSNAIAKECNIETNTEEASSSIRSLCRICSSKGLISIHTGILRTHLKIRIRDHRRWNLPISQVISEISGEAISVDDRLPQFICEHCLGYLQHAYEIRLKIQENADSLRIALSISNDDSIHLEKTQIDQSKVTKQEVKNCKDVAIEESIFFECFQGADIKIVPKATNLRVIEQKCPSCKKRLMSIKSLNDHMAVCEISILDEFFGQFKSIYSQRLSLKLTTKAFVLHSIKLVFDIHKRLQAIVKANNIDVNAVTADMPAQDLNEPSNIEILYQRAYQSTDSPDIGYSSCGGRVSNPFRSPR